MLSEGSCDTVDWSNDAGNSALIIEINYIKKNIQIENSYFKYFIIFVFICILNGSVWLMVNHLEHLWSRTATSHSAFIVLKRAA